ncbi:Os02g0287800 [Oryza sativa Japonica Group]|uniref:Os02g0287800 protein n=1 Tax=Oryza sativa subsp. japonica TaxID=39947 RepID=A0A0P0VHP5_ORYSJ|nr:hypothetical protein EE612_010515 [Oryza sativa]BAS78163.1 Os02g0287800 [Oryza sativa Japonica Group]
MEGQGTHPAMPAAAVSVVLDDDDLLREIILRLAFPTDLVRAAAVCRRWLRVASAPAFLRRYRALHPPRVLGLFAKHAGARCSSLSPIPAGSPPPRAAPRRAPCSAPSAAASRCPCTTAATAAS